MDLGDFAAGETLIFPAQCVDTAGSAINPTGVISYVVWEDETAIVGAGVMTNHASGALGFNLETIVLNAPYAEGHTYTIQMYGTVDGETPAAVHRFRMVDQPARFAVRNWDEPIAGHAHAQTFGAIQYLISNYISSVVANPANTPSTFETNYGATFEGQLLGKILFISWGANAGATRIVTAFDPVTKFVTVAPPLPFTPLAGTVIPLINIPTFWDHAGPLFAHDVWQEQKADHQGATIMGNIAEDTDNLDFRSIPR